jgi:hypothetical protein
MHISTIMQPYMNEALKNVAKARIGIQALARRKSHRLCVDQLWIRETKDRLPG